MKKLGTFIVLLVFFANTGCSEEYRNPPPTKYVEVTLKNVASEAVHMWITGDQINPNNKLQPGETTRILYHKSDELLKEEIFEESLTIYAGRNGSTLTSRTEKVSLGHDKMSFAFNGRSISKN